jgi:WD40 repeat protein
MNRRAYVIVCIALSAFAGSRDIEAHASTSLFVTNNLTNSSPGGRLLQFDGVTGQFQSLVANIDTPRGIAVGPGGIFVASANGASVSKFSFNNGLQQSTFVLPGSGGLQDPWGLSFGSDGDLYIAAGSSAPTVLRYDGATGAFLNVFATSPQQAGSPFDLAFAPNGNLLVGTLLGGILQFDGHTGAPLGVFIPPSQFQFPASLTFGPDHNLYVATESANSVLRFNGTTGAFIDTFVTAGSGGLNHANGVRFGPDGDLFVASGISDAILRYNGKTGAFKSVFASTPIDAPILFAFVPEPPSGYLLFTFLAVVPMSVRYSRARRSCFADG